MGSKATNYPEFVARLTEINAEEAALLGDRFGLEVVRIEALDAGSVNSNFRLHTPSGRTYFARVYEEQGPEGARAELALLRELAAAGVPTTVPLAPTTGPEPSLHRGKPFAIYPWVQGEIRCRARVQPPHLKGLGSALGRLHQASSRLSSIPRGRFGPDSIAERLGFIERALAGTGSPLLSAAGEIRQRLEQVLSGYAAVRASLPQGVIHGDLFRDNVIWSGDSIEALIDFESASLGPFAFDLMVCIEAWCYGDRFELDSVRQFLQGYLVERRLTPLEVEALPQEGILVALRFATTRITDFSMRAAPGAVPGRDYRRFLDRMRQLEAGALRPVLAELEPESVESV